MKFIKKYDDFLFEKITNLSGETNEKIDKFLATLKPNDALEKAVQHNYITGIQNALTRGANVNHIIQGQTILIPACIGGNMDFIKYLVEQGAKINYIDKRGNTALMFAAIYGHLDLVKYLVGKGANVKDALNDYKSYYSVEIREFLESKVEK